MRIEFAIVAEAATLSSDGKFSILNAEIGAIQAPSFPATHPVLACVIKIGDSRDAITEEHTFRLEVLGPEGTAIAGPAQGPLQFRANPFKAGDDGTSAGVVVTMPALTFPVPGEYEFRLFVDDEELGSIPFYAVLNQGLAGGAQSTQIPTPQNEPGDEPAISDAEVPS